MTFSHRFGPRPKALPWCVALMLALAVSPAIHAASAAGAAGAAKAPPVDEAKSVETTKGKWTFHLLPKTLQKNPALDMTVITEMTPEGAKRPLVTPEAPAYYFLQPTKLMSVGEGSVGRKPVPADALQAMMQSALAKNGFLAAAPPEHAPTLLLVCEWGLHAGIYIDEFSDPEIADIRSHVRSLDGKEAAEEIVFAIVHDPDVRFSLLVNIELERKNLLERASLVGGEQFARVLKRVLEQTADQRRLGVVAIEHPEASALHAFVDHNPKARYLFDQAADDVYFVVATAYDYDAFQRGDRHGLWRTKMTVNTAGVSMAESMPVLVRGAAPFLGRPMSEAAMLNAPVHRGAQVDIGPVEVVPEPAPAPAPERK